MVMQAQSTPHTDQGNAARDLDSVSPVVFAGPETGALFEASRGEAGALGASSSMATSSSGESVELSQLYQDICDQKDIIMTCLEEDNCDIDQVRFGLRPLNCNNVCAAECGDCEAARDAAQVQPPRV